MRPSLHMLWNGQAALCCGTRSECIAKAKQMGLLTWDEAEGCYALPPGAVVQIYPASSALRWFSADEVEAAKEHA